MAAYLLPAGIIVCLGVTLALLGTMNREAPSPNGSAAGKENMENASGAPCRGCATRGLCTPPPREPAPEPDAASSRRNPGAGAAGEAKELE